MQINYNLQFAINNLHFTTLNLRFTIYRHYCTVQYSNTVNCTPDYSLKTPYCWGRTVVRIFLEKFQFFIFLNGIFVGFWVKDG